MDARAAKIAFFASLLPATAVAATYYVSPTGSDAAAGTSEATALATPDLAASLVAPGDTVLFLTGTFTNADPNGNVLTVTISGTPTQWITFAAAPGHKPTFSFNGWNAISLQGVSYVAVIGFTIVGNADHITAAEADAQKANTNNPSTSGNGISASPSSGTNPHHLRIADNVVSKCCGGGIGTTGADYVTVEHNDVHENAFWSPYGNSGISLYQLRAFDQAPGYHNVVRANRSYLNREYVPVFSTGTITDGNGIIIDDSRNTQNGSTAGVFAARTLVVNNVVYGNGGSGIHCYSSDHVDIVNNTGYQNYQTPINDNPDIHANTCGDVQIVNNVVVSSATRKSYGTYQAPGTIFDYNVAFGGKTTAPIGTHDLVADPRFVQASLDPTVADFRLGAGSPAIGSGSPDLAPADDIDGNPRSAADGIDRGAYQRPSSDAAAPEASSGAGGAGPAGVLAGDATPDGAGGTAGNVAESEGAVDTGGGGCGCSVAAERTGGVSLLLAAVAFSMRRRRRR